MNPNYEQDNLRLPRPMPPTIGEHPPAPIGQGEQQPVRSPEAIIAAQQMPTTTPPQAQPMSVPGMGQPAVLPLQPQQVSATSSTATPQMADDSDLIEKEWVEKAKAIVAGTRDDPYTQSQEVTRIKADYIKKRYNKDIKLTGT